MMGGGQDWAVAAARAILDDISTRSRLGPALEQIDADVRREIETTFAGLVRGALEARLAEAADAPLPDGVTSQRCIVIEGEAAALYRDGKPVLLVGVDAGEVLLDLCGDPISAPVAMRPDEAVTLCDHIVRQLRGAAPEPERRPVRHPDLMSTLREVGWNLHKGMPEAGR